MRSVRLQALLALHLGIFECQCGSLSDDLNGNLHAAQVLVGNKCDMDEAKRKVPYSKGQALADEFGIRFFETSAKTNSNVEEVNTSTDLQKGSPSYRGLSIALFLILEWAFTRRQATIASWKTVQRK